MPGNRSVPQTPHEPLRGQALLAFPQHLLSLVPAEHEQPLLERLRAAEPAGLGDSSKRIGRSHTVPDEPGPDHDTGPSTARPAVDVDEASRPELAVDLVERRDELLPRRDGEVADRHPQMARRRLHEVCVRLELTVLSEVEKEAHTRRGELAYLGRSVLGPPGARVPARDEPIRLDHGGWAHDRHSLPGATTSYLVRGDRSQSAFGACR